MGSLRIAVIGAGWAGCAAAVESSLAGHVVTVFEAARQPGGRARSLHRDRHDWEAGLDNGQHILLGAYRESLRLMKVVGVDPKKTLLRLPLQIRYPAGTDGMDFHCTRLPAPLHLLTGLLRTRGLDRADKLALARFSSAARWIDWRLNGDRSVDALLAQFGQTQRVIDLLWRPLCLAALNTPPSRASAQVFLNVLRDSLGASRQASDMLLPRRELGQLFPEPALRFVERHNGQVLLGHRVRAIDIHDGRFRISDSPGSEHGPKSSSADASSSDPAMALFDRVIVALPAAESAGLLATIETAIIPDDAQASASNLGHESITTCYLRYPTDIRLALPVFALRDDPGAGRFGQFVFDRGQLDATQRGVLAVVISASTHVAAMSAAEVGQSICAQLAEQFSDERLRTPMDLRIISEKRATFSCTPGIVRPSAITGIAGLFRAGDHVAGDYPSTIEGAVRSGIEAARLASAGWAQHGA